MGKTTGASVINMGTTSQTVNRGTVQRLNTEGSEVRRSVQKVEHARTGSQSYGTISKPNELFGSYVSNTSSSAMNLNSATLQRAVSPQLQRAVSPQMQRALSPNLATSSTLKPSLRNSSQIQSMPVSATKNVNTQLIKNESRVSIPESTVLARNGVSVNTDLKKQGVKHDLFSSIASSQNAVSPRFKPTPVPQNSVTQQAITNTSNRVATRTITYNGKSYDLREGETSEQLIKRINNQAMTTMDNSRVLGGSLALKKEDSISVKWPAHFGNPKGNASNLATIREVPSRGTSIRHQGSGEIDALKKTTSQIVTRPANQTTSTVHRQSGVTSSDVHQVFSSTNTIKRQDSTVRNAYANQVNNSTTVTTRAHPQPINTTFNRQPTTEYTNTHDVYSPDNYVRHLPSNVQNAYMQNAANNSTVTNRNITVINPLKHQTSYQTQSSEVYNVYNQKHQNLTDLTNPRTQQLLHEAVEENIRLHTPVHETRGNGQYKSYNQKVSYTHLGAYTDSLDGLVGVT